MTMTEKEWGTLRRKILFWAGIACALIYTAVVTMLNRPFHFEFLLLFASWIGVSLAQGYDHK